MDFIFKVGREAVRPRVQPLLMVGELIAEDQLMEFD
jgi:hypothetical protein